MDLIKYRLPYLENEHSFCGNGHTLKTNELQNNMLERIKYNSSKPSTAHTSQERQSSSESKPKTTLDGSEGLPKTILRSLSDAMKTPVITHTKMEDNKLPPILPQTLNLGERSFNINGVGLSRSQSLRESPVSMISRSPIHRSPVPHRPRSRSPIKNNYSNPRSGKFARTRTPLKPEYTQSQCSKTENDVMQQAKELLNKSGIDGEKVLPQDLRRLGRGVSSLYLADFGLHGDSMSPDMLESPPLSPPTREHSGRSALGPAAQRHIYMCQTPSLMPRTSMANASVRKLKAEFGTRRRGTRQIQGRFVEYHSPRGETPRRKPFMLLSEKSMLYDPKRSIYKSHESLYRSSENLYQSNERLNTITNPFDIQGRPVSIIPQRERVL